MGSGPEPAKEKEEEWFGSYQGGSLRWNTLRKRGGSSRYTRRYKDSDMIQRILSTRIDP